MIIHFWRIIQTIVSCFKVRPTFQNTKHPSSTYHCKFGVDPFSKCLLVYFFSLTYWKTKTTKLIENITQRGTSLGLKNPLFFWGFFLTVQTRKLKCTEVCIFGLYFLRNAIWSQPPTLPSLQSQRANSPYWLPNFSSNFSVKNLAVDLVNIPQTMPKGSNSRNQSTWEYMFFCRESETRI